MPPKDILASGQRAVEQQLDTLQRFVQWVDNNTIRLIFTAIVIAVGYTLSRWVASIVGRAMDRQNAEPPVRWLMVKLTRFAIIGLTLFIVAQKWEFPVTGLAAGLGGIGLGVGIGMQGFISNMTAGLIIIFTKPFRVGEYVEILGVKGRVSHINLMSTMLIHADTSRLIIPNQKITGEVLHNFGRTRQIELSIGVDYETDLDKARGLVRAVMLENKRILSEPSPAVVIGALQDSSILIKVFAWTSLEDLGPAQSELYQGIVQKFRENHIEIPYPQHEVRVRPTPVKAA